MTTPEISLNALSGNGPVFLLASMVVRDHPAYLERYVGPVTPMLERAGAEILAATAQPAVVEGDYSANWTVIIRFPSVEAARGWYLSEDYKGFIGVRQELSEPERSTLLFLPSFDSSML